MTPRGERSRPLVLHVGHHDPEYSRNRLVRAALLDAGTDVETVAVHGPWRERAPRIVGTIRRRRPDLVWLATPGLTDVPAARLAATLLRSLPVVVDAFVGLHETFVEDRARIRSGSLRAGALGAADGWFPRLGSLVVTDTDAHARYFADRGVPSSRLVTLPLGSDLEPAPTPDGTEEVLWYGSYLALHGIDTILDAAGRLANSHPAVGVRVVGDGPRRAAVEPRLRALPNVTVEPRLPADALADRIRRATVCLGVFGGNDKADRVVPNKVYDALAVGRPVVTADTTGARELLTDGETALLCPPSDGAALAAAIGRLLDDHQLRARIAACGHVAGERHAGRQRRRDVCASILRRTGTGPVG